MARMMIYRLVFFACAFLLSFNTAQAANLDFTVNTNEAVVVTGTPRLTLTIGSATRFANYNAGASTSTTLVFRYAVQAGDFDADGITVSSPVDLNGGTIRDAAGNNLVLTYTAPNTTGIRIQTYQVVFTTDPITAANETAAAFQMTKAPVGATFNYSISSSGGGTPVTGSGTISTTTQNVTGINVSTLPPGTLTVSLTMTDASGTGSARTDTVTSNVTYPLDTLSVDAAYSVRRLKASYTGNALQIQRASDNTTSTIGYTYTGRLDTAAIISFCSSTTCRVRTWYDQSGSTGREALQNTFSAQPLIYNGTSIETSNSLPTLVYEGAQGLVTGTSAIPAGGTTITGNAVGRTTSGSGSNVQRLLSFAGGGATNDFENASSVVFIYRVNSTQVSGYRGSGVGLAPATNSLGVFTAIYDGTTGFLYGDGINSSSNPSSGAFAATGQLRLGINTFSDGLLTGSISEAVYLSRNLTTGERQALEANQKSYFGTP